MPIYRDIDFHDIPKVLRVAGSGRTSIDTGDYAKVIKQMETVLAITPAHLNCDDHDISEIIINAQVEAATDTTPPAVSVLNPFDNATGVAVGVKPAVTFDEPVVFGVGQFSLRTTIGGTAVAAWVIPTNVGPGIGQASLVGGDKVSLWPPVALTPGVEYYITWTAGVVRDIAGNNVAAQASTTAWSFTTA